MSAEDEAMGVGDGRGALGPVATMLRGGLDPLRAVLVPVRAPGVVQDVGLRRTFCKACCAQRDPGPSAPFGGRDKMSGRARPGAGVSAPQPLVFAQSKVTSRTLCLRLACLRPSRDSPGPTDAPAKSCFTFGW